MKRPFLFKNVNYLDKVLAIRVLNMFKKFIVKIVYPFFKDVNLFKTLHL